MRKMRIIVLSFTAEVQKINAGEVLSCYNKALYKISKRCSVRFKCSLPVPVFSK